MADTKLSALTETTSLVGTDEIYVNDGGASRRITLTNFLATIEIAASQISDVTSTAAELNILDGVTSTAAELNILDGVTSTAAELNILDGVTSDATEINLLDGVTSLLGLEYTSTGQTITTGGLLTLPHSLGVEPKIVQYILECTSNEDGYVIGDRFFVSFNSTIDTVSRFNQPKVDATNIVIRFADDARCFTSQHATTGAASSLTNANFQLYVIAFA